MKLALHHSQNAALKISTARTYGRSGIMSALHIRMINGKDIHHVNEWHIGKQKISHSSYGVEITACADADD